LPYPVLSDPDLAAIDAYDVRHDNEPTGRLIPRPGAFIIDRAGRIQFAYKGDSVPDRPSEDALLDFLRTLRQTKDPNSATGSHHNNR
jgi:peroxiredoxin